MKNREESNIDISRPKINSDGQICQVLWSRWLHMLSAWDGISTLRLLSLSENCETTGNPWIVHSQFLHSYFMDLISWETVQWERLVDH